MIAGIGTDIIAVKRIRNAGEISDPFFTKVFTSKEIGQALHSPDPWLYLATRFAGKEAVYKSIGLDSLHVRLIEIEILNNEAGQPQVTLTGKLRELALSKGIDHIYVSLSSENDYAVAIAVAQLKEDVK